MEEEKHRKSLLNMPGDELSAIIKRISKYTICVELVALAAFFPLLTNNWFYILYAGFLLLLAESILSLIFRMKYGSESKLGQVLGKIQTVLRIVQAGVIVLDLIAVIMYVRDSKVQYTYYIVAGIITVAEAGARSACIIFDYRGEEDNPFFRIFGAVIVAATAIVCKAVSAYMINRGIVLDDVIHSLGF